MTRTVCLSDLTDREKDNTILVLAGYARALKALVEEAAATNGRLERQLDQLLEDYGPRLAFLETSYRRSVLSKQDAAAEATRNDRFWGRLRGPGGGQS